MHPLARADNHGDITLNTSVTCNLLPPVRPPVVSRLACAVGLVCAAMGFQAQATSVYVSNEKDNKIVVFDAQGKQTSTIDVCKRPRHLMFNADRSRIFVCCGDSNELGVVDRAAGKMLETVPLGDSPEIFDLSPDGKVAYVSIEDESVLAAYDLATKKEVFRVKTGGEPEGVLVSRDGKTAYVTSEEANVIHVIDLVNKKVSKNIKVGKRPRRFAMSPDSSELWISNELSSDVSVVDTATHTVKATVAFDIKGMRKADITPVGVLLTKDGKTAWVSLGKANHVAEVDVASRTVLAGKRAWGLALSPDEATLYVTNALSDDMTLVDTREGKAIRTVAAGRVPHTPLVAP